MRISTYYRLLLALVALVAAAYLASAVMFTRTRGGEETISDQRLPGSEGATSIIENFEHVESKLDKVGWELKASKAELLEGRANLYDISMRFYTPEKEVIALTGRHGSIDLNTKDVTVTGEVEAVYNDTYRFYAEQVSWDSKKKTLTSPGPVRIVGPEGEITGAQLLARPNRKRFIIKKGVSVDFKGNLLETPEPSGEEPL